MNRSFFILVVEDNPDHQLLIGYSLRASIPQAEPVFVSLAEEALSYLDECFIGKKPFPKLCLLGIKQPPPESAWYLLKQLRKRYPCLPVLVLSAQEDSDCIRLAYELGAHSFLTKPRDLEGWEVQFKLLTIYWLGVVTLPSIVTIR
jgi:CheY-like chemotaxis protein